MPSGGWNMLPTTLYRNLKNPLNSLDLYGKVSCLMTFSSCASCTSWSFKPLDSNATNVFSETTCHCRWSTFKTRIYRAKWAKTIFLIYLNHSKIQPTLISTSNVWSFQKVSQIYMGVSENRGFSPKMDGENNGSKPYEQNGMIWGYHFPIIFGSTPIWVNIFNIRKPPNSPYLDMGWFGVLFSPYPTFQKRQDQPPPPWSTWSSAIPEGWIHSTTPTWGNTPPGGTAGGFQGAVFAEMCFFVFFRPRCQGVFVVFFCFCEFFALGRVKTNWRKKLRDEIESNIYLFPLFPFINPVHLPGFVGFLSV